MTSFIYVLLVDAYCVDPEASLSMLVPQLAKCVLAVDSDVHRMPVSNLDHFGLSIIAFLSRPSVRDGVELRSTQEDVNNPTSDGIRIFTRQQNNETYFLAESDVKRIVFVICKVSGRRLCRLESRLPVFEDRFTAGKAATESIEHSNIRVTAGH